MARYQVTSPNGEKYEVEAPDDATSEQVMAYAQKQFAQQQPQPGQAAPASFMQRAKDFMTTAPEAPPRMPLGDLVTGAADLGLSTLRGMVNKPAASLAGLGGAIDPNDTYAGARDRYRQAIGTDQLLVHDERLRTPQGERMADAYGGAMRLTGIPQTLNAIGSGIEQVAGPEARDFVGSAASVASAGLPRMLAGAGRAAPSVEDLAAQSKALYKTAEQAGVVVPPARFGQVAQDIEKAVAKEGYDPDLHPEIAAALKRLNSDAAKNLSLEQLEILRRVLKGASEAPNAHTRSLAHTMISKLDDFVENMNQSDLISGSPQAGRILQEARTLWSRMSKGSEVEEMMQRARVRAQGFSASGLENALRVEFRQLALNPRRMRLFTKDEQAAIRKVAMGGALDNALRMVGKLAPTGVVSGGAGVGLGYLAGGPVGAVAVPAVGAAARLGATGLTIRNANLASELMRRGGPAIPQTMHPGAAIAGPALAGSGVLTEDERRRKLLDALIAGPEQLALP